MTKLPSTPILQILRYTNGQAEIRVRATGRRRLQWATEVLQGIYSETHEQELEKTAMVARDSIVSILGRLDDQGRLGPATDNDEPKPESEPC